MKQPTKRASQAQSIVDRPASNNNDDVCDYSIVPKPECKALLMAVCRIDDYQ